MWSLAAWNFQFYCWLGVKSELFFLSWALMFLFADFVFPETFVSDWMSSREIWAPSRVSWRVLHRRHLPFLHKDRVGGHHMLFMRCAWHRESHCISTDVFLRPHSTSFASPWTSSFWNFNLSASTVTSNMYWSARLTSSSVAPYSFFLGVSKFIFPLHDSPVVEVLARF